MKQVHTNFFISYILSDQVLKYNIAVFELFQKLHLQIYAKISPEIYASQFMTS